MNKAKKLIILLSVVIVLVGGYFAASHFFKDDDDTQSDPEQTTIALNAMHMDDIVGIQYNYADEVITLEKTGDVWHLKNDADFPVNQTYAETMALDAANLTARRLVSSDAADFAEYGLDAPTSAYVFTKTDGDQVTYMIGNYNNYGGTYYMNVSGTSEIYLIEGDFLDDFDYGKMQLADVPEMMTASTDQVTGLSLQLGDQTTQLQYYEGGLDTAYTASILWFINRDTPADEAQVRTLIGRAVSFSSSGCAAYSANGEELADFGLDDPLLTLSVSYTDTEEVDTGEKDDDGEPVKQEVNTQKAFDLTVGKQSPDGSYYAKQSDADAVYLLSPDYVESLQSFEYDTLRAADVCQLTADEVTQLDVTFEGKTHTIKIDRKADTAKYAVDGKAVTEEQFSAFFSAVRDAASEGFAPKETDSPVWMKIVYHTNRYGFETVTLTMAQYDRNLYVAVLDEGDGVLFGNKDAEKIRTALENMTGK